HAICQVCGSLANYSYRIESDKNQVLLGEKDAYEPRCRTCYIEGDQAREKHGHRRSTHQPQVTPDSEI
ncbi:MAG: hypothetical protein AAFP00_03285, partial [Bacteroidota bacterium]